ncbi:MAG: AAA family ATPase [Myxococcota bacterium]
MSSFVRNQLVDQVYLPLVGDNLAKQLGAAGAARRTDLMGLLLLVSPPGYGKTTLMEYVAHRLGLTFDKVNGPAIGHGVTSLDPAEAPDRTARQEIERIGFALEMGNNVMLYLDDIQHCHPELLQKFISLCDGQRRIEGVWQGRTRTYDLRGKKFCVVMAGNPYTEAGARFTLPDMLANRADTYNLGDVLSGREEQFALSFLENAVTSNPVLAPLAARPSADLLALVRMARGEDVAADGLSVDDGAAVRGEMLAVLRHLMRCQRVLLQVNAEYIRSAAMEDAYRTEPRFQLQGSYRNLNKLCEKVVPVMEADEVDALVTDHYRSEAQTLTTGAEANLLRLGELRGTLTEAEAARWAEIRAAFRRRRMQGDGDPASRVTGALTDIAAALAQDRTGPLVDALAAWAPAPPAPDPGLQAVLGELRAIRAALDARPAAPNGHDPEVPDELGHARRLLLAQVRAALGDGPRVQPRGDATTLAAALSVIERLTVHMATVARGHLSEAEHQAFVAALKRSVAGAVNDLADGVREGQGSRMS